MKKNIHWEDDIGCLCLDIDECTASNASCQHICANTVGSFVCSCRRGYYLGSDKTSCYGKCCCLLNPRWPPVAMTSFKYVTFNPHLYNRSPHTHTHARTHARTYARTHARTHTHFVLTSHHTQLHANMLK